MRKYCNLSTNLCSVNGVLFILFTIDSTLFIFFFGKVDFSKNVLGFRGEWHGDSSADPCPNREIMCSGAVGSSAAIFFYVILLSRLSNVFWELVPRANKCLLNSLIPSLIEVFNDCLIDLMWKGFLCFFSFLFFKSSC